MRLLLSLLFLTFFISCVQQKDIVSLPERIDKQEIKEKFADLPFDSKKEIKIAMLLPLSGKHKKLGLDLYKAAQLALFDHGDPRIVIYPFDTKGNGFTSVEVMKDALAQDIKIIIGPLFSSAIEAVTPLAANAEATIFSFSNNINLAKENVFVLGVDLRQQVQTIVNYTLENDIRYLAALLPGNKYGAQLVKYLREATKEKDATILKSEFYIPQKNLKINVNRIVRSLTEIPADEEGKPLFAEVPVGEEIPINEEGTPEYKDIKSFNRALLVADNSSKLSKIGKYLNRADFLDTNSQIISVSILNNNLATSNRVFEGSWYSDIAKENYNIFATHFNETFNKKPNRLAALSYDIVSVISSLASYTADSDDDFSKDLLFENLYNKSGFSGINGIFRFNEDGVVERLLEIYQIENSAGKTINPAPYQFVD